MNVLTSTRHNLTLHTMLRTGDRLVVAVSGGQDSLCLLHVLMRLGGEMGFTPHAAHLNHGLRGAESDADAAFVAETAAEWGIGATIETADVKAYRAAHHLSLEDAARRVRYAFLQRVAAATGAAAIATGHTADDQIETIIMHWLRGAGPSGLRGMAAVQTLAGGVRLIRPLLDVTRQDTADYCREHFLRPRQDASNDDTSIRRNYVRHTVLPALARVAPGARTNILRTAQIMAGEDGYMQQQAALAWSQIATVREGAVTVDLAGWMSLHIAMQRRILREAWKSVSGSYDDLSWLHVERVLELVAGAVSGEMNLPHGVRVQRGYQTFTMSGKGSGEPETDLPLLTSESLALAVPGDTALPETDWIVHTELVPATPGADAKHAGQGLSEAFDAGVVGQRLLLRRWQRGDRMRPLGMVGEKKVHDIMVDNRTPRALRHSIPLLVSADQVLWVVGARRSDMGKVTAATRTILLVSFRRSI